MNITYCRTALRMRELGMTYDEIGKKFGVSRNRAWQIVRKAKRLPIREYVEPNKPELNILEIHILMPLIDLLKTLATYGAENENETVDPRSQSLQ